MPLVKKNTPWKFPLYCNSRFSYQYEYVNLIIGWRHVWEYVRESKGMLEGMNLEDNDRRGKGLAKSMRILIIAMLMWNRSIRRACSIIWYYND